MPRSAESDSMAGIRKARTELQSALTRMGRELSAVVVSQDTEWTQAWPMLKEIAGSIEQSSASLLQNVREAMMRTEVRFRDDADSYPDRLVGALREKGHAVTGDASRPVVEGVVFLEVDAAKAEVRLNGSAAPDINIERIVAKVADMLNRIRTQASRPEAFEAGLERAYDEELRASGLTSGTQVHVAARPPCGVLSGVSSRRFSRRAVERVDS